MRPCKAKARRARRITHGTWRIALHLLFVSVFSSFHLPLLLSKGTAGASSTFLFTQVMNISRLDTPPDSLMLTTLLREKACFRSDPWRFSTVYPIWHFCYILLRENLNRGVEGSERNEIDCALRNGARARAREVLFVVARGVWDRQTGTDNPEWCPENHYSIFYILSSIALTK